MPEDEEMANTPGVLGDGIVENGVDPGAARRGGRRSGRPTRGGSRPRPTGQPRGARRGPRAPTGRPGYEGLPRRSWLSVRPRRPVRIPIVWPASRRPRDSSVIAGPVQLHDGMAAPRAEAGVCLDFLT